MNYKLTNYKFVEIQERSGLIENNSNDMVEISITNEKPITDNPKSVYLKQHEKYTYKLVEGYKIYAKTVVRLNGDINVLDVSINNNGGAETPIDAYTKAESDEKFISKTEDIQADKVKFKDGKTFQQKLDEGSLRGQTGKKGQDGAKGEQGFNGLNGMNGLNIKIIKGETHLKGEYGGDRVLYSYASKTESGTRPLFTYSFTNLKEIKILNAPLESVKARVKVLSFIGVDSNDEIVGSINPTRNVSGTNIFPHLGNLDPTNGKTFEMKNGQVSIPTEFDTEQACLKEIEELNKIYQPQGKTVTRISQITYTFEILNSTDEVIAYAVIVEKFNTDIKEKSYDIMPLNQVLRQSSSKDYTINYCTETEYRTMKKIQDDKTIYMILNEETGNISLKVYRP